MNNPDVATLRARGAIRTLATPKPVRPSAFIAGRFPYTYAADHVRVRGLADSRADASQYRRRLAEQAGLPDEFVAEMFAIAYCQENNIEMPASLLTPPR